MLSTPAGRFRVLALAEAVSWIGLLTGMFFKYVVVRNEIGVQVFGPIHGAIFVGYVLATLAVRKPQQWDVRTTFIALLASIPPFGTVIFERWANKQGKLEHQSSPSPTGH
jgi:integral membrane protein